MAEPYRLQIIPSARRGLVRIPDPTRQRIRRAIRGLAANPRPTGAIALRGQEGIWRIRVGDHRVLCEIRDRELLVLVITVAHRGDVCR